MIGKIRYTRAGHKILTVFTVLVFMMLAVPVLSAQVKKGTPSPEAVKPDDAVQSKAEADFAKDIDPKDFHSILFTQWEHVALEDARHAQGVQRAPTQAELERNLRRLGVEEERKKIKPPPEQRNITLGGIAYTSKDDWTIWLNGQRVTPKALPGEILDLKVYNEYVEFKWFDDFTNQIFPIRLRPHQRFNIDARIFLPG